MDEKFGAVGTVERNMFRKETNNNCVGQLIMEARKQEKISHQILAERVETSKSYISRVEKGITEPGVGMFFRILNALGLRFDVVKPMPFTMSM